MAEERRPLESPPLLAPRTLLLSVGAISSMHVLHAGLAWEGRSSAIPAAVGASALLAVARLWRRPGPEAAPLAGMFSLAQAALLGMWLMGAPTPYPLRDLVVALVALYVATLVLVIGIAVRADEGGIVLLAATLALGVLASEGTARWIAGRGRADPAQLSGGSPVIYRGALQAHPEMGQVPIPGSVTESLYPTNPRGYFRTRTAGWSVEHQPTSSASLELGDGGSVRADIERADEPVPWHVQLMRVGYRVRRGGSYTLRFEARADREREYAAAVGMAHEPWETLGLYRTARATTEWAPEEFTFRATASDDDVRVYFPLGGDTTGFEVRDVRLTDAEGRSALGAAEAEYFVQYRWNAHGCRAPEYAVPAPPRTFRIVALGDSYTQGAGVHVEDLFTTRLEALLGERATRIGDPRSFEVVGCGVSGFATREERLYYEERARAYRPDVVLVIMVANDQQSFLDDVRAGLVKEPGRLESLLGAARLIGATRRAGARPDFAGSAAELAVLNRRVLEDGARLGVVAFSNLEGPDAERLSVVADSVSRALDVPFLDLRDALRGHPGQDLYVHPGDGHPNEVAHGIAARAMLAWLEESGLLAPPGTR